MAVPAGSELKLSKSGSDLKLNCQCPQPGDTTLRCFRAYFAVRNFIPVQVTDASQVYKMSFLA